jgi:hypothetical protein
MRTMTSGDDDDDDDDDGGGIGWTGAAFTPSGGVTSTKKVFSEQDLGVTVFQLKETASGKGNMPQCVYKDGHERAGQDKPMCFFRGRPAVGGNAARHSGDYAKADDATAVHESDCKYHGTDTGQGGVTRSPSRWSPSRHRVA